MMLTMAKILDWARNIITKNRALNIVAQFFTRFLASLARWRWGVLALFMVVSVIVAFECRVPIAMKVGYVSGADGMSPGARFFRDFMIFCAAIVGILMATWRNSALDDQSKAAGEQAKTAAQQFELAEDRLLGERFTVAAELMAKTDKSGKPVISTRTTGIYIMADLAIKNPAEFTEQVVVGLISYIKDNAQITANPPLRNGRIPAEPRLLGHDVKSAFRALEQILVNPGKPEISDNVLDFSHQNFSGLNLNSEHVTLIHYKKWTGTDFRGAGLQKAHFADGAILQNAKFQGALLKEAVFGRKANLSGAELNTDLSGVMLQDVDLSNADLQGARLARTRLEGADLLCAKVRGANLSAYCDEKTNLNASYGLTYMKGAEIPVPLAQQVKEVMDDNVWHGGEPWAIGINQCKIDSSSLLMQQAVGFSCYALPGVLRNVSFPSFDSSRLVASLKEHLDKDGLPKDTPEECRDLIARMMRQE